MFGGMNKGWVENILPATSCSKKQRSDSYYLPGLEKVARNIPGPTPSPIDFQKWGKHKWKSYSVIRKEIVLRSKASWNFDALSPLCHSVMFNLGFMAFSWVPLTGLSNFAHEGLAAELLASAMPISPDLLLSPRGIR